MKYMHGSLTTIRTLLVAPIVSAVVGSAWTASFLQPEK